MADDAAPDTAPGGASGDTGATRDANLPQTTEQLGKRLEQARRVAVEEALKAHLANLGVADEAELKALLDAKKAADAERLDAAGKAEAEAAKHRKAAETAEARAAAAEAKLAERARFDAFMEAAKKAELPEAHREGAYLLAQWPEGEPDYDAVVKATVERFAFLAPDEQPAAKPQPNTHASNGRRQAGDDAAVQEANVRRVRGLMGIEPPKEAR